MANPVACKVTQPFFGPSARVAQTALFERLRAGRLLLIAQATVRLEKWSRPPEGPCPSPRQ